MNITDFLAIGIIGVLVSLGIQYIQGKYGTSSNETKLIAVLGSIIIGSVYVLIRDTSFFPTIVEVLGTASTIFALVFNGTSKQ